MTEDFEHILYDVRDSVASITLNRPEKLNAYVPEMGDEVVAAFRHARESENVRAVILTGAGRGFCAGVDLEALKASYSADAAAKGAKLGEEDFVRKLPLELWEFPKPVIAAINGHAIGVGVTMTLACDVRLAAEDAKIGLTFAKLGILPGLGSTSLLPRLIGMAKAQELVLSARVILGDEAAEIGLVNRAVPGDRLLDEARSLAQSMAAHDPEVLAAAKRSLHEGAALSLADAMKNEQALAAELRRHRANKRG
jgi:enoyl-CoA hydratase/carnithine racemase